MLSSCYSSASMPVVLRAPSRRVRMLLDKKKEQIYRKKGNAGYVGSLSFCSYKDLIDTRYIMY